MFTIHGNGFVELRYNRLPGCGQSDPSQEFKFTLKSNISTLKIEQHDDQQVSLVVKGTAECLDLIEAFAVLLSISQEQSK